MTVEARLLAWYDANRRALPWRAAPGETADPYRVLVSEVMLQQTTVAAVRPRLAAFLARFPSVAALAAAPEGEVMNAWAGLGYYARARNLHAAAKAIAANGWPADEAGLRALPGFGAYTAAAVTAIAFGQRAVAVDANVARVVARLFAVADPLPGAMRRLRALADTITPDARAGDFAQAMMDLGSGVCTPRAPTCPACPLAAECRARAEGRPDAYPVKAAKSVRPVRRGVAWALLRGDTIRLERRPPRGLLGGMMALPCTDLAIDTPDAPPPCPADWRDVGAVAHGFTHFHLDLRVLAARADAAPPGEGAWWPLADLGSAGLPTVFARAAALAALDRSATACFGRGP